MSRNIRRLLSSFYLRFDDIYNQGILKLVASNGSVGSLSCVRISQIKLEIRSDQEWVLLTKQHNHPCLFNRTDDAITKSLGPLTEHKAN